MATGGTGSFGRSLAQSLLATDMMGIRIFTRDELKQRAMFSKRDIAYV
jgi:FlaA1/EpsC-like NDP-sugar epimerase